VSAAGRQLDAGKRVGETEIEAQDGEKRRHVAEIQRARILSAMFEVCLELGASDVAVADVVARAGVSRRTFYELFDGCEDCLLAAFDEGIARASRYVLDGNDPKAPWAERIRSALTGLLSFLDVERCAGRLLIVGSLGAGAVALERRERVLAQMIALVDEGRTLKGTPKGHTAGTESKASDELSPLTAEGIVGAVLFILHRRMIAEEDPGLMGLLNPLMSMIVLPYLGAAAARRELARPVLASAPASKRALRPARDPLTELDIRLTYRTMRVLLAIGSHPRASNRQVGRAAGIEDPGQISKLLARLARIGLIANAGAGAPKGAPNSWTLTPKGTGIRDAIALPFDPSTAEVPPTSP
jgi:AcrR family transcriptional regulator